MFHTYPEYSMCYFPSLTKAVAFTCCYVSSTVNLRNRFGVGIGEVYMCVYVLLACMHVWAHMHIRMQVCRLKVDLWCPPLLLSTLALETGFPTKPRSHRPSHELQRDPCLCLPGAGVTDMSHAAMGAGI